MTLSEKSASSAKESYARNYKVAALKIKLRQMIMLRDLAKEEAD